MASNVTPLKTQEQRWEDAQEGAELLREGQLEEAKQVLEQALSHDSHNEYIYFYLGHVYYEQQAHERALKAYLSALELAPDYVGAMNAAGHTLRMMGRYRDAIRMGAQILSRNTLDGDGLYLVGISHFAEGDLAQAERYLTRFLETRPEIEVAMEVEGLLEAIRNPEPETAEE